MQMTTVQTSPVSNHPNVKVSSEKKSLKVRTCRLDFMCSHSFPETISDDIENLFVIKAIEGTKNRFMGLKVA